MNRVLPMIVVGILLLVSCGEGDDKACQDYCSALDVAEPACYGTWNCITYPDTCDVVSETCTRRIGPHPAFCWSPDSEEASDPRSQVNSVAFSPDGSFVVAGSDKGLVRIWGFLDAEETQRQRFSDSNGDLENVGRVAFSPLDENIVALGVGTKRLMFWDTSTHSILEGITQSISSVLRDLAFSPDGKKLVGVINERIKIWNADKLSGNSITEFASLDAQGGRFRSAAFSENGQHLATGYDTGHIRIWDLGQTPPTVGTTLGDHSGGLRAVVYSSDGKWLASGTESGEIFLWNATNYTLKSKLTTQATDSTQPSLNHGGVMALAISPDSRWLVASSLNKIIEIWDLNGADAAPATWQADKVLVTNPTQLSYGLAFGKYEFNASSEFMPDAAVYLAAARQDGVVHIWKAGSSFSRYLTLPKVFTSSAEYTGIGSFKARIVYHASDLTNCVDFCEANTNGDSLPKTLSSLKGAYNGGKDYTCREIIQMELNQSATTEAEEMKVTQ